MKPKLNRKNGNKHVSAVFDECQTPPYVVDPLLPYLRSTREMVWESASGLGILAEALSERGDLRVLATGLPAHDYFEYEPGGAYVQVTNPPYSIKYEWLERAYDLDRPFALLMPSDMASADKAATLFEEYGVEIMYLRPRADFVMPRMELYGNGAQFGVAWYCWKLLPEPVMWCKLDKPSRAEQRLWWEQWKRENPDAYWQWWAKNAYPVETRVEISRAPGVIVEHVPGTLMPYRVQLDSGGVVSAVGWAMKELK